jgi:flagellar biosynthetic protein FliR
MFVFIAPFFSMNNTPARVRVGISMFTAILLYGVLTPAPALVYDTLLGYTGMVLKEAVTGLLLGFGSNVCMSIVNFAGSIVDMETGLSMVSLMDPTNNQYTSISGVLYQYTFMLMLLVTGMYRYLLGALADSFLLIPVNGAIFHIDYLLISVVQFLGDYIVIGFRICLPVFCVSILLNAVLGVLAKVAPQMNMFVIGIQLKVLTGLGILFITAGMLPSAADFVFQQMKQLVVTFVEGMT